MKKFLLYVLAIVCYSVIVVLLRNSDSEIPNWVFWVISFVFVAVLGAIGSIGKGGDEPTDNSSTARISQKENTENKNRDESLNNGEIAERIVENEKNEYATANTNVPSRFVTNQIVFLGHSINFPFVSSTLNINIRNSFQLLLSDFEKAVEKGDKKMTIDIYNKFQKKIPEKFGDKINNPIVQTRMLVFKYCGMSKDLLDLYKMVIEGHKNDNVLSGKGSIRRILKYSIELGAPTQTLDMMTDYFVNNSWFDNMPEQGEWLKLALECMMVTGNGELGNEVLERLEGDSGISEDEKEELLDHAREFRSQIDDSWMKR